MAHEANKEKSKVRAFLDRTERGKTEKSFTKTLGKTAYQIGVGVIGGSVMTALIGKPAFLSGLGATLVGNFFDVPILAPLGIGMMTAAAIAPKDNGDTIKDRFTTLSESFMSNTYLDKVFGKKNSKAPSNNNGSPGSRTTEEPDPDNPVGALPEETLNNLEQQLVSSAMAYQNQRKAETTSGVGATENDKEMDFSRM